VTWTLHPGQPEGPARTRRGSGLDRMRGDRPPEVRARPARHLDQASSVSKSTTARCAANAYGTAAKPCPVPGRRERGTRCRHSTALVRSTGRFQRADRSVARGVRDHHAAGQAQSAGCQASRRFGQRNGHGYRTRSHAAFSFYRRRRVTLGLQGRRRTSRRWGPHWCYRVTMPARSRVRPAIWASTVTRPWPNLAPTRCAR